MSTYGRNFDYRVPPKPQARGGRWAAPATLLSGSGAGGGTAAGSKGGAGLIPIGAPVVADLTAGFDSAGRQIVKLPAAGAAPNAMSGVLVYEYGPAAYAGSDPFLTTYSDLDYAPLGAPVQVVSGDLNAKMVLTNVPASTFLSVRSYPGRIMVNGFGATATVAVGDYLVPGNGNDVDGYWQSQSSATGAWAVITMVDSTRLEVEARMLF